MYVFSDSVLCLGSKCEEYPKAAQTWTSRVQHFVHCSPRCRELDNIDGEPVVFKCKIFSGHTTLEQVREVQELMEKELKVQPHNFEDLIFMSVCNDI